MASPAASSRYLTPDGGQRAAPRYGRTAPSRSPHARRAPPSCAGQYRIDGSEMGLLGSGAHGIVRIAQHVETMECARAGRSARRVCTYGCGATGHRRHRAVSLLPRCGREDYANVGRLLLLQRDGGALAAEQPTRRAADWGAGETRRPRPRRAELACMRARSQCPQRQSGWAVAPLATAR